MSVLRFLEPQEDTHADALAELKAGRKTSHWIWWELPQLAVLGRSPRAVAYGLADLDEAAAYWAHPILSARLLELVRALLQHAGTAPEDILGAVDAAKVRSMATLFAHVPGAPDEFQRLLDVFYGGETCAVTQAEIAGSGLHEVE